MGPRALRHAVAAVIVLGYLLAAAVVVIAHPAAAMPGWLALHLLLLGAATNAVFVWSRHFAQALLHARPGSERLALLRLAVLNAGVAAVLAGVSAAVPVVAVAGAVAVVGAVIAHSAALLAMARSRSLLAGVLGVVVWYYIVAAAALAVGGSIGAVLAAGSVRSAALDDALVLAHAHLNLLGWLGFAIIGTEFMLWPTVLRTRMSQEAPRTARRVLLLTGCGIGVTAAALLAGPYIGGAHWLAAAGMAGYAAGVAWSMAPAVMQMRAAPPRSAAAWALLAGNTWLLAALVADAFALAAGPAAADRLLDHVLVPAIGVGAVGQILIGALTYLLPVTIGGGPAGSKRLTRILDYAWRVRAVIGNSGVLALVALSAGSAWRIGAWAAVLAGFGTFPVLAAAALATARRVRTAQAG